MYVHEVEYIHVYMAVRLFVRLSACFVCIFSSIRVVRQIWICSVVWMAFQKLFGLFFILLLSCCSLIPLLLSLSAQPRKIELIFDVCRLDMDPQATR